MEVFVTARAEKDFDSSINFIQAKWEEATTRQFIQKVDNTLNLLRKFPELRRN